jgi:hypothetical protein
MAFEGRSGGKVRLGFGEDKVVTKINITATRVRNQQTLFRRGVIERLKLNIFRRDEFRRDDESIVDDDGWIGLNALISARTSNSSSVSSRLPASISRLVKVGEFFFWDLRLIWP